MNPPASAMFDDSGPVPELCSCSTFSGVSAVISDSWSAFQLISVMQWSCRPSPTGRSLRTSIPSSGSVSPGPTPDSISSCGDWYAPADRITSREA